MRRESQPRPRIEGLALPVRRALVRNWSDVATDVAMRPLGVAVLARNCTCRCAGLLGPAITCVMSPQAGVSAPFQLVTIKANALAGTYFAGVRFLLGNTRSRRRRAQPSLIACRPRPSASASAGTS